MPLGRAGRDRMDGAQRSDARMAHEDGRQPPVRASSCSDEEIRRAATPCADGEASQFLPEPGISAIAESL